MHVTAETIADAVALAAAHSDEAASTLTYPLAPEQLLRAPKACAMLRGAGFSVYREPAAITVSWRPVRVA